MKRFSGWQLLSLLLSLVSCSSTSFAGLVINEFMYHPESDDDNEEFIEIHNPDASAVPLDGYCITGIDFCFANGTTIEGGEYLVLAKDAATFQSVYGFAPDDVYTGKLSNSGELLQLIDATSTVVDEVFYDDAGQWPPSADGLGLSLERISPTADGNSPRNWHASTAGPGHTGGAINSVYNTALPPWIANVSFTVDPDPGESITVVATIDDATNVSLIYLIGFGTESTITMLDDGQHSDGAAGDGVYGATIPGQLAATLVRFRIAAQGASGTMHYPRDDDTINYTGTVVADSSVSLALPIFHWYIDPTDYNAALSHIWTDETEPAVFYYNGVLYDNIRIRVRGQTARQWPKKHWKFSLPQGHELIEPTLFPIDIDQFNLQSSYGDKSYCREVLAYETFRDAGNPNNIAFHVRLQQNGEFFGLYTCLEAMDAQYLERNNLNEDADWYKAFDDARYRTLAQLPTYYEKKRGTEDDYTGLYDLINGANNLNGQTRTDFLYSNLDIPGMINYLATNCLIHNNDLTHKNYYFYCDASGTNRWVMHPWDMDLTFGRIATWPDGGVLDDGIYADNDVITGRDNVSPSHPLFGDTEHQKWDYRWNYIIDALYEDARFREMYQRRLRTLMDDLLTSGKYEARLDELAPLIAPEAEADRIKWGQYGESQTLSEAISLIKDDFLPRRRTHFFDTHRVAGEIPASQASAPQVIISEIMYNPGADQSTEFVELYNPSSTDAVDLTGWRLQGLSLEFPPGAVLPANDYVVVTRNDVAFRAVYGGDICVVAEYDGSLDDGGQELQLVTDTLNVVDYVRFDSATPWPTSPNGGGPSLELIDSTQDNSRPANWAASLNTGGTPGTSNTVTGSIAPIPALWINEVLQANTSVNVDEQGEYEPWIEIYNRSESTIDLGGMYLTDDYATPNKWQIPAGTALLASSWLVIWADGETGDGLLHTSFSLNAGGGVVGLYSSAEQLIDYLNYPALAPNASYGKFPDGEGATEQLSVATPGTANRSTGVSIILNEYNAVGSEKYLDDDGHDTHFGRVQGNGGNWFELVVTQNHSDLRGWQLTWTEDPSDHGTITFTDDPLWSDLQAGTIITFTEADTAAGGLDTDATYNPTGGDWWININTISAGSPSETYATTETSVSGDGPGNFSVGNDNWQLTILNGSGQTMCGPVGEGIKPVSGIGSTETFRLEENPSKHIHPLSNYDDGTTSTFGAPNTYAGGTATQDFGVLRGNEAPDQPVLVEPADGTTFAHPSPTLRVTVTDTDNDDLDVTFFGREMPTEFSIIVLPDTQFYSATYPEIFNAQIEWIVANQASLNIAYVAHLGDLVDTPTSTEEWNVADAAMAKLEDPVTTGLPEGIPYGVAVGNHDQYPINDPGTIADEDATTALFNSYFGLSRFDGRSYYGGHYSASNDNHCDLFSASGMQFVAIYLEHNPTDNPLRQDNIAWAESVLQDHSSRHAFVVSHYILDPDASFTDQGQAIYDSFKDNGNLFMMTGGHLWYAARRTDSYSGHDIHTLLSNYQAESNGGNGWLRIYTFHPTDNLIEVTTYSPWLDQYKSDSDNQFTISYEMDDTVPFVEIDTVSGVTSGSTASINWPGRHTGKAYQWYVTISDTSLSTTGPRWRLTSNGSCATDPDCDDNNPCTNDTCNAGTCEYTSNTSSCDDGLFCTTTDLCSDGQCIGSGDACPDQLCDEESDICVDCFDDSDCIDPLFCNGLETCQDGECVAGDSPCEDQCEQCEETNGTCNWCIYDLDGDGFIGPGDFAFFAGCYGSAYDCDAPTYRTGVEQCCIANFDESDDSFVGPGDFAGFAGCFGSECGECETCWGAVE